MPLRDDLLNPIPGPNPSGENLRYAPVYDQIKEARREEEEINQGEWATEFKKADWVLVVKLCSDALANKSKDLQLASWLTEALVRREGFVGLRDGLGLIGGLLENYWETLYPELEDGDSELRATPLEWVGSRLDESLRKVPLTRSGLDWLKYKDSRSVPSEADAEGNESKQQARAAAIEEHKLTPEEFDQAFNATPKATYDEWMQHLDACLEAQRQLNQACEEKFGSYAPNFTGLRKSLEEIKQTVHILLAKKREQEAGPEEQAPRLEAPAGEGYVEGAAAPARAPARKALAAEPADRDDAIERVAVVARWFRQNDSYSPVPYLLVRALRWGELRAGGADVDPTLLEAPPTETRQELKRLAYEGDWTQVLEIAETAAGTPCGRGWLDLQRYSVRACQELGYEAAASAIRSGLRALLADYPQLPDLTLMDDTPTANAETKAWLKEQVAAAAAAPGGDLLAAAPSREEETSEEEGAQQTVDAYDLALEAARSGRAQEAIEILAHEAAAEGSGRGRFRRRVQLAQICLGAGHATLAYPILQDLAGEIESRNLENWEAPDMISHPLALLFRCMAKMDISAEEKQKIYGRICRLDPIQALSIHK
ncbi:MAG: type VI secretion system protein TssA [Bryobacteraceae bacterium]|jgi:type VI secretion system protein ImpA